MDLVFNEFIIILFILKKLIFNLLLSRIIITNTKLLTNTMNNIPTDVLTYNIFPCLLYKDLKNLEEVFQIKVTKEDINKSLINTINYKLRKLFGDKLDEFKNKLQKCGGVISGSFIVQCILDEDYKTDIDIFIPVMDVVSEIYNESIHNNGLKHLPCVQKVIKRSHENRNFGNYNLNISEITMPSGEILNFTDYDRYITELEIFLEKNYMINSSYGGNSYDVSLGDENTIHWIRDYIVNKSNVQVIHINEKDTISNYINESFDYDICKNIYGYKDNKEYLNICNFDGVINKKCEFKFARSIETSVTRFNKYIERGFKFTFEDPSTVFKIVMKYVHGMKYEYLNDRQTKELKENIGKVKMFLKSSNIVKDIDGNTLVDLILSYNLDKVNKWL